MRKIAKKKPRSKPRSKSFPSTASGTKKASEFYRAKKKAGKKPNFRGNSKKIHIGYKK